MRLFFAVWPPRETAAALHEWSRSLQGRATPAENIHLTLAFLGDADPERAVAAGKAVRASRHELVFDRARYVKRSEMVWLVAREAPIALVESLHFNLKQAGFVLEDRPFAAHVTLLRRAPRPRVLPPLPPVAWPLDEFLLVRSRTSPEGSRYEPLASFPLSA